MRRTTSWAVFIYWLRYCGGRALGGVLASRRFWCGENLQSQGVENEVSRRGTHECVAPRFTLGIMCRPRYLWLFCVFCVGNAQDHCWQGRFPNRTSTGDECLFLPIGLKSLPTPGSQNPPCRATVWPSETGDEFYRGQAGQTVAKGWATASSTFSTPIRRTWGQKTSFAESVRWVATPRL